MKADAQEDGCLGFATLIVPYHTAAPECSITAVPLEAGRPWRAESFEVGTPASVDRLILDPETLRSGAPRGELHLAGGRGESVWK